MTATPCQDAPEAWVSDSHALRADAARECRPCLRIQECFAEAMRHRETFGVFGGVDFSDSRTRPKFPPLGPRPINHGTVGGYRTHQRRGEKACDACNEAAAVARANPKVRAA